LAARLAYMRCPLNQRALSDTIRKIGLATDFPTTTTGEKTTTKLQSLQKEKPRIFSGDKKY
jgi:hypothetical protein